METEVPNRRLSATLTLTVLVALLVLGAVLGLRALFAPLPEDDEIATSPTCVEPTPGAPERIEATDITVSVYNGSNRDGLASATIDALAERGFRPGAVGNAPEDSGVKVVQVWTTEEDDPEARLVALQFGKKTKIVQHDSLGQGIDVVLGPNFRSLAPGAPTFVEVKADDPAAC